MHMYDNSAHWTDVSVCRHSMTIYATAAPALLPFIFRQLGSDPIQKFP